MWTWDPFYKDPETAAPIYRHCRHEASKCRNLTKKFLVLNPQKSGILLKSPTRFLNQAPTLAHNLRILSYGPCWDLCLDSVEVEACCSCLPTRSLELWASFFSFWAT